MSKFIGRTKKVAVGLETTRGTKSTSLKWLKYLSCNVQDKIETKISERAIGVIEDSEEIAIVKKFSGGALGGEVMANDFGIFLKAGLGSCVSAVSGNGYLHTFNVLQNNQHPSISIVSKDDNEQLAFPLSVIESLEITSAIKDYVQFTANVRGKKGAVSNETPAFLKDFTFLGSEVGVKIATNLAGLEVASEIDVNNVKITINKNIEDIEALKSDEPKDFVNKAFSIEGSLELIFDNTTIKDYALSGENKALRIEMENVREEIATGVNAKLVIDLAKVTFTEPVKTGENNDVVKLAVGFKGLYSADDSKSIEIKLTNSIANY